MVQAKKVTKRRKFDDELKNEIIRMLNSGRNVKEISQAFDIAENVLYRWKTEQNMKQKTKNSEDKNDYTLRIIAENEQLKKDNLRIIEERDILKKALAFFSRSS